MKSIQLLWASGGLVNGQLRRRTFDTKKFFSFGKLINRIIEYKIHLSYSFGYFGFVQRPQLNKCEMNCLRFLSWAVTPFLICFSFKR